MSRHVEEVNVYRLPTIEYVYDFTKGLCHVLAMQLHELKGWPLVGVYRGGFLRHVMCERPQPDKPKEVEWVDVRGCYLEEEAIRGSLSDETRASIEKAADEERLTDYGDYDWKYSKKAAHAVLALLEKLDEMRRKSGSGSNFTVVGRTAVAFQPIRGKIYATMKSAPHLSDGRGRQLPVKAVSEKRGISSLRGSAL